MVDAGVTAGGINLTDQAGFADGLEPILPIAFRLAYAMLRHRDDAEDAVQEAAAKAWRKRGTFREGSELRPWFLAIVGNECRMALRRSRRGLPPQAPAGPPDSDESVALRRALNRLHANHRLVLVMRYYLDLPFEEIGRTLGISSGAARVRVHRALARLRPAFEVAEESEDE